jgi:isopentenyl-diphosphate delta-isomerase type 1
MSEHNEIFDVVDSEDMVIGKASRLQVHNNDLMHRSVHILVFNSTGSLFLQKRAMIKDESPGLWDSSAAGHVESGEDYISCAKRELNEELSLSDVQLDEVLFIQAQSTTFWEHVRVYKCVTDSNICINKNEISEGRYMKLSEVRSLMQLNPEIHTPTFSLIYANYINKLG